MISFQLPKPSSKIRSDLLTTADGGTLRMDWIEHKQGHMCDDESPAILVFPPVGTCSVERGFSASMFHSFCDFPRPCRIAHICYQGLGGVPLSSSRLPGTCYCGTDDVGHVLQHVHTKYPNAPILVVCSSVGSAYFTRWIGSHPEKCTELNVIGAVACAHGYSSAMTTEAGDSVFYGLAGKRVIKFWREQLHRDSLPYLEALEVKNNLFRVSALLSAQSAHDWDVAVLPLYGYSSMKEMLEHCDAVHVLPNIPIPILFVNADDDPVCPSSRMIHFEIWNRNPLLMVLATSHGGHLGWHDGAYFSSQALWIKCVACEFFEAVLKEGREQPRRTGPRTPAHT